jgi:cellulose biosynthesis protein BcsQ
MPVVSFLNQKGGVGKTTLATNVATALALAGHALANYADIPILAASITQRVSFAESAASGQSVLEVEPHGPASHEIRALTAEITELVHEQDSEHQDQPAKHAAVS